LYICIQCYLGLIFPLPFTQDAKNSFVPQIFSSIVSLIPFELPSWILNSDQTQWALATVYLVRSRLCYRLASVVCMSVCTECIVAKRCVVEQKLLLTACMKSYMRNRLVPKWMNLTFV